MPFFFYPTVFSRDPKKWIRFFCFLVALIASSFGAPNKPHAHA